MHRHVLTGNAVSWLVLAGAFTISSRVVAQGVQPAGSYAQADIAYGAQLYAAQCATCHGQNGDQVGGINLRAGSFRSVATDQDLMRVMTTGVPAAGMPAFRFDPPELAGLVAFVRSMNTFDPGSVAPG